MIKVLFLGTGDFAVSILDGLIESADFGVVGVVTQPDKPVGREQNFEGGAVKRFFSSLNHDSREVNLRKIFQPDSLRKEAVSILNSTQPDVVVVAAYGQMVPDIMLETPRYKALNIHGSLLPELRGAVPVQMAILEGLPRTGVSIQLMAAELDAGAVLSTQTEEISSEDTTESLMARLSDIGRDLLLETLSRWISGEIEPQEQSHSNATYCYQSDTARDKAEIFYETDTARVERMVRALYPWPVAWLHTVGDNKRLKIFRAQLVDSSETNTQSIGFRIWRDGKRLYLDLHDGVLELLEVQLEGKQRRDASEYLFLAD